MKSKNNEKQNRALKVKIIAILLGACIICLGLVWTNAQASKLQYEINSINNQISEAQKTERNLEVQIKTAGNITNLEERALEIGLVYPTYDSISYICSDTSDTVQDLALALKESVYR